MVDMTRITVIFLFICCASTLDAQHLVDTLRLNSTFRDLQRNPDSKELQKEFLEAFPDTWESFIHTYGYYPNNDTMYQLAYSHIMDGLGKYVNSVPDSIYCDKLIKIALFGRWGADAPNYFQQLLWRVMEQKTEVMFQRLSVLWDGNVFPFWFFFFHSLCTNEIHVKMFGNLYTKMYLKYPSIIKDMTLAFQVASGKASIPPF